MKTNQPIFSLFCCLAGVLLCYQPLSAQTGTVKTFSKISTTEGGFSGSLDAADRFGASITTFGDLDGDGINDIAVGAYLDDEGGGNSDEGAVYILAMNTDGTVKGHQKIGTNRGGFSGFLRVDDYFGRQVCAIGDVDGDLVPDLAVAAPGDDDGGNNYGAVWIVFLNSNGTVKGQQKISRNQGGFSGNLQVNGQFGTGMAALGDMDGDGVPDLAVGSIGGDDGVNNSGEIYLLFLNDDGTVKSQVKISNTSGNLSPGIGNALDEGYQFGNDIANMGDMDGNGTIDLAVGAYLADDGGQNRGAVLILFLNSDGTVLNYQKISETHGNFSVDVIDKLDNDDQFGFSLANVGDLDGNGVADLAVGAIGDDDGGTDEGAIYLLFLEANGTVQTSQKISSTQGSFSGNLDNNDRFAFSLSALGDLNGDNITDLAVGAAYDDDGGQDRGAVYTLFLNGVPSTTVDPLLEQFPVSVFPNPATDYLNIRSEAPAAYESVTMHNLLGQIVWQQEVSATSSSLEIQVPLSDLETGLYILRIHTQNGQVARRVWVK